MTPDERTEIGVERARILFLEGRITVGRLERSVERALAEGWILANPERNAEWQPFLNLDRKAVLAELER